MSFSAIKVLLMGTAMGKILGEYAMRLPAISPFLLLPNQGNRLSQPNSYHWLFVTRTPSLLPTIAHENNRIVYKEIDKIKI